MIKLPIVKVIEGDLYGVRLCYGRATGFNTYGKNGFPRGARMIKLHEDSGELETWLRLEGGVLVKDQPLHQSANRGTPVWLKQPYR